MKEGESAFFKDVITDKLTSLQVMNPHPWAFLQYNRLLKSEEDLKFGGVVKWCCKQEMEFEYDQYCYMKF